MGQVSAYLRELIAKQVKESGLVVWFDPERHYEAFARALSLPGVTVARYDGSFFALRRELERLLNGEQAPRLVVYVPLAQERTGHALVELTCCGVVLKPGQTPWQRNTRLAIVATHALEGRLGQEQRYALDKQIEAGQLTFEELDSERYGDVGVLATIFGTGEPQEIALRFLSGEDGYDAKSAAKSAGGELAALLSATFGVDLPADEPPREWRARLARYVLCTEFVASLHDPLPPALASVRVASEGAPSGACVQLARMWRLRRDVGGSYVAFADRVERELGLGGMRFDLAQIRDCETFAAVDDALQSAVESALLSALLTGPAEVALDEPLALAERRRVGFWPTQAPDVQARWALIVSAGRLLVAAGRVREALRRPGLTAEQLFRAYTEGDRPWCELDTLQRELESRRIAFDVDDRRHAPLVALIELARDRYLDVGSTLAERFVVALAAARFQMPDTPRQRDVYARCVSPALRVGKTAYILVDALRFEMARELARSLGEGYECELFAALGTLPSITPIGMAALLPGAEADARVVPAGGGLGLSIAGTILKDRKGRVEWLKANAGLGPEARPARVFETTLEALLDPKPKIKGALDTADLVFVTSQEIDQLCESDNILMARSALDLILVHLQRGIRRLAELGCQTIVFTADHGFLFAGELGADMKLDPPGGETVDLHRRVWVGRGGAADEAYVRAPLAAFDLSDDPTLELATPRGFGGFKVQGGARAYFHGGMSPQEIAIPVVALKPLRGAPAGGAGDIEWRLALGSKKISTRFCSARVGGEVAGLFGVAPPTVRVEARQGPSVLSRPVAAAYGFIEATGDVRMRFEAGDERRLEENTVTLAITHEVARPATVSILLLDAATGRAIKRLDGVETSIAL